MNENIEEFGAERQRELSVIEASGLSSAKSKSTATRTTEKAPGKRAVGVGRAGRWVGLILRGINTRERQDG